MIALDPARRDENLVERPRLRQPIELAAFELDGDQRLRPAILRRLIEIGADRRTHRVEEAAQDAVLVETLHLVERRLDPLDDLVFLPVAILRARIEPRVKQRDDIGGDTVMLAQRRPHIVLRERHLRLLQEARDSADQRHVAPHQSAGEHQRVVTVVVAVTAHDDEECCLQPLLQPRGLIVEIDFAAIGALQEHVVEPGRLRVLRRELIGALVDDAEAHILQHRHPLRQRQRPAAAPYAQPDAAVPFAIAMMEIDTERALRRQSFQHADRGEAIGRLIVVAIAGGKRLAVALVQGARRVGRMLAGE